jgi:cytoskeletal protein CcmA (bactofilin family)
MKYGGEPVRAAHRPEKQRAERRQPSERPRPPGAVVAAARPRCAPPAPAPATAPETPARGARRGERQQAHRRPNIKLKGVEIEDCDTLVVEGRIEATMVSRAIQIAEHGSFAGKVDVDVAEIRGTFQGEMTARKKLVIHASGRVSGKIRYGKMLVQEGGEMSGDIASLSPQEQAVALARPSPSAGP